MFDDREIARVTRDVLIALGIEVQKANNLLFYQDSKSPIFFESHPVKANINPDLALFTDKDDVRFNPVDPRCTKLMERFFGKFLDDNAEEENIANALTYYFDKDKDDGRYKLTIKFDDGTQYEGNWYINKVICFLEAIFQIDGTFAETDLSIYDIDQSMWGIEE